MFCLHISCLSHFQHSLLCGSGDFRGDFRGDFKGDFRGDVRGDFSGDFRSWARIEVL